VPVVRAISWDDMPWLRGIFARRYPNNFDADTTERWMRGVVLPTPTKFHPIRTEDALCITLLMTWPWLPNEGEASVIALCCDIGKVWQTLPLLRCSLEWARRRNATAWHFQSDLGQEFGPLMRRLGIPESGHRYKIDLSRRQ
jgi:hypothetical protein